MLYIFLMMLVGYREPDALRRYQAAIEAATSDPEEQRLLGTVARTENYFHAASATPPFGLTWESELRRQRRLRQQRQRRATPRVCDVQECAPFTVETGAVFALRTLRALRRTCAREVAPQDDNIEGRWLLAISRYLHGTRGPHHGCWADDLAVRQITWMQTVPPLTLPARAITFGARRSYARH